MLGGQTRERTFLSVLSQLKHKKKKAIPNKNMEIAKIKEIIIMIIHIWKRARLWG